MATIDQLRRGRGAGYRAALAARSIDDVLACVLDDPRWDREIETRDDYYARLLIALDAPVDAITGFLQRDDHRDESDVWLAAGVLAEMARREHRAARDGLVAALEGPAWARCLEGLGRYAPDVVDSRTIASLADRVGAEQLREAITWIPVPWDRWIAEVPALRFPLRAAPAPDLAWTPAKGARIWAKPPVLDDNSSDAELDALARRELPLRVWALRRLGERGCTDHVAAAAAFLASAEAAIRDREHGSWRTGYMQYLERLPAEETLPLARSWFEQPWPLGVAGAHILARHATIDDRERIERSASEALARREMFHVCSCVDALTTIGSSASLPILIAVYEETPYAYARPRVVRALTPHVGDPAARALVVEALWDCEEGARKLACAGLAAADEPVRLAELADDRFEDDDLRAAARAALAR
jgi:hypothetical protein